MSASESSRCDPPVLLKMGHSFYSELLIGQAREGNRSCCRVHGVRLLTLSWSWSLRRFPYALLWKEATGWSRVLNTIPTKYVVASFMLTVSAHGSGSHSAKQHVSHGECLWDSWLTSSSGLCDRPREAGVTSGPMLGGRKELGSRAQVSEPLWEQSLVALQRTQRMEHSQPSHGTRDTWLLPIPACIPKSFFPGL